MRHASLTPSGRGLALALAIWAALAGAAEAQTESVVQNVRFGSDAMSYEAPRVIVRGSALSQAELSRLLDPASPEPWSDRLAKLDAEEILAPEVVATLKMPRIDQRTTYRDVSLKSVRGGRIATITAAGGSMEGTQQGRKVTSTNGPLSMQDVDAGAALALLSPAKGPAGPLRQIYGAFSMEAVRVTDSSGITTQVGRMSGSGFSARPTALGWTGTIEALGAAEAAKDDPAALTRTMDSLAELFEAFSIGTVEASDISMKGHVEKDDVDLDVKIARAGFTGAAAGRGGEMKVEDLDISAAGMRIRYGTLAFGGLNGNALVETFRELAANPDHPGPALVRRLLPVISSIRIENLDVQMPPGSSASGGEQPGRIGLGRFEIAAEKPINGIPTDLRFTIRNMSGPVSIASDQAGIAMLGELGYERLDGSLGLNLGWNEPGQELVVRDISVDGKDMGTATLRGVIGRVSREVFNTDTAVASVALLSAAAKSIELVIEDRGLFERIVAREAKRQKRAPEDVRREYAMAASVGIPAVLGSGPAAKTLAQAVARFVAKPGKLTIQARARQPGGFGLADYMANPTPAGVLEAIDLTATAE